MLRQHSKACKLILMSFFALCISLGVAAAAFGIPIGLISSAAAVSEPLVMLVAGSGMVGVAVFGKKMFRKER